MGNTEMSSSTLKAASDPCNRRPKSIFLVISSSPHQTPGKKWLPPHTWRLKHRASRMPLVSTDRSLQPRGEAWWWPVVASGHSLHHHQGSFPLMYTQFCRPVQLCRWGPGQTCGGGHPTWLSKLCVLSRSTLRSLKGRALFPSTIFVP